MKTTLMLVTFTLFGANRLLAQGTINFNNLMTGVVRAPIYGMEPGNPYQIKTGNAVSSVPPGAQTYGGAPLAGTGYTCQLWGRVGTDILENQLELLATTTFRT